MDRNEFMKRLEALLSDLTPGEREEALHYYNDYLDDAGVENEPAVILSLGSPERVAETIKEGLKETGDNVEYTERGYENRNFTRDKSEVVEKKVKKPFGMEMTPGMIVVVVIIAIIVSPIFMRIVGGLFELVFGTGFNLLGGILTMVFGVVAAAFGLFIAAAVLIGIGIATMIGSPVAGILLIGAGIFCAGLAVFFLWLSVVIFKYVIPWFFRFIGKLFRKLFHKKEGRA